TAMVVGVVVNGLGCGLLLPTLVTWNMRELPFERRGLGTGAFMSSFFLGQFVNPIIVISLAGAVGGRPTAVQIIGWVLLAMAALARAEDELHPDATAFLKAGGTQDQFNALSDPDAAAGTRALFDATERAVMRLAIAMTRDVRVSDEIFAQACNALPDERQAV